MSVKQSPDALVSMYRREVAALASAQWAATRRNIELEVRFQDVDAANFASIYAAMVAGAGVPAGAPTLSMTIGAIMPARPRAGANTPAGAPAPSVMLPRRATSRGVGGSWRAQAARCAAARAAQACESVVV